MSHQENSELLARCARGEQDAWSEVVERFNRLVWSVIGSYRMRSEDAEDVRQLTWFRLVQNVHRIRDPERLGDWLATVARREAGKAVNRSRRMVMIGDCETLEGLSPHSESPEQIMLQTSRNQEVMQVINSLSPQCREVLLRALSDPPAAYEKISTELSMPVGSVGPVRTRCLRRLRRALDPTEVHHKPVTIACHSCPTPESRAGDEPQKAVSGSSAARALM